MPLRLLQFILFSFLFTAEQTNEKNKILIIISTSLWAIKDKLYLLFSKQKRCEKKKFQMEHGFSVFSLRFFVFFFRIQLT